MEDDIIQKALGCAEIKEKIFRLIYDAKEGRIILTDDNKPIQKQKV